ncbi:hypothetical protein J6590_007807 [Homalodisca vitripennis]|nr:hypothetical protein J6590_007807 [Homalodisca vitripennis]
MENSPLQTEIERLRRENDKLLNYTIQLDIFLLNFTYEIFPASTLQRVKELTAGLFAPTLSPSEDPVRFIRLQRAVESIGRLINSFKTTIEVLKAEKQDLKFQLETCSCNGFSGAQPALLGDTDHWQRNIISLPGAGPALPGPGLEDYIATSSADTELVLANLPHIRTTQSMTRPYHLKLTAYT